MNFQDEMKYFEAVTFDDYIYHFAITPKGEISCSEFGITVPASIIELKPNFVLRRADGSSIYSLDDHARNRNKKKSLISHWKINEEVFEYLINNKKVMYSTDMAVLYGFDSQYAYDAIKQRKAYRRTKNNPARRARVLAPLKAGKFN